MDFTREPIIETIISPREGFKLLVRNSKGDSAEEYCVDALEVVSFGTALFLRSLERPKSFLLPVGDYEILETKEVRTALKNISHERNIKIGGGREAPVRSPRAVPERDAETVSPPATPTDHNARQDNKRDRGRRHRNGRRRDSEESWAAQEDNPAEPSNNQTPAEPRPAPTFTHLFPPPTTLISETIDRYKGESFFGPLPTKEVVEEKKELSEDGEPTTLNRTSAASLAGFDPFF